MPKKGDSLHVKVKKDELFHKNSRRARIFIFSQKNFVKFIFWLTFAPAK